MSVMLEHINPNQNLQLRPMQMHDLDEIMQIEPTIYSHPWTRGNFSDSLNSDYSGWVLERDGKMIGYALLMMIMDEAHLLNLSVTKQLQKQGLGRFLLEHMLKVAKNHQAKNMFLEVRPSNVSAIALYGKLGFCEMALRRGYYPAEHAENNREDAILMGLTL